MAKRALTFRSTGKDQGGYSGPGNCGEDGKNNRASSRLKAMESRFYCYLPDERRINSNTPTLIRMKAHH